ILIGEREAANPADLASALVHESVHARAAHAGKPGPRVSADRSAYIEAMMREEADGIARQAEVHRELAKAGQVKEPTRIVARYLREHAAAEADLRARRPQA